MFLKHGVYRSYNLLVISCKIKYYEEKEMKGGQIV